ncbi:germ cell-less protein-like 1 isoform X2 [Polypterus senegalus]|uniref:germ cell-less protein-like 1 isoform X2 n=1 Tax=Polypterus senegalus TaxID=55291 RepID=UPI001962EAF4|nr:germ cell-less protein-like 1 isoform X2 [Polypterus senegalus]
MGSWSAKFCGTERADTSTEQRKPYECRKRKRRSTCQCDSESEEDPDRLLNTPRRKMLKTTSTYIYQTLFLNGQNSDIRICALGQEWDLHKVYLCQSGYFSSMFSGSWKESSMAVIQLEIPDENIDVEGGGHLDTEKTRDHLSKHLYWLNMVRNVGQFFSLQVAFGSLYRDDVLIKPSKVVAVLAAACMLQLDGLIQQCGETMKETVSDKTVCCYYTSASTYGLDSVKKKCLEWLLNNLMTHPSADLLKQLSVRMMEQLVRSPDLFVMQVEMDVYTTLKKWMFLQLVPSWNGNLKHLLVDADNWISKQQKEYHEEGISFLESERGAPFTSVFKHIRLQYVINDLASARIAERDAIIPCEWLLAAYKQQWFAMLKAEHDSDWDPRDVNKEEFELSSMRCGRKLTRDGDYCWRWTGFSFGFDLLVTYTNRFIVFKRNTLSQPCSGSVSLQPHRNITYRLRLASFDVSGKVIFSRSTGCQVLSLEKDQEYVAMNLDSRLLVFPLYICCNFLFTQPRNRGQESTRQRGQSNSS